MHFMADLYVTCEHCGGTRFKPEILEVRYGGVNIHEALQMSVRRPAKWEATSSKAYLKVRVCLAGCTRGACHSSP